MRKKLEKSILKKLNSYLKRKGRFSLIVPARKIDTYLTILNKNNLEDIGILQLNVD